MTKLFSDYLKEKLKNPEFKKEYDALEPEYELIQELIELRKSKKLTQKDISNMTGIHQTDISRLEQGKTNPTLETLSRIAESLDSKLKIVLVPKVRFKKAIPMPTKTKSIKNKDLVSDKSTPYRQKT